MQSIRKNQSLIFIGPILFLIALAVAAPVAAGIAISFYNPGGFAGVSNYVHALSSGGFWQSLCWNAVYAAAMTIVVNLLAMAISSFICSSRSGNTALRVFSAVPGLLGGVCAGVIWAQMSESVLKLFGIEASGFGMLGLGIMTVWQLTGLSMFIYLAAIAAVPRGIAEAAVMDGATGISGLIAVGAWEIRQAMLISGLFVALYSLRAYDQLQFLNDESQFISTVIYDELMLNVERGVSQAKAVLYGLLILATVLPAIVSMHRRRGGAR